MLKERLEQILAQYGSEEDNEFEHALTRLVSDAADRPTPEQYLQLVEGEGDQSLRYAAFYCLTIRYREDRDISKLGALLARYESQFKQRPTFHHLKTLYLLEKEINSEDSFQLLLSSSYEDSLRFPDNPGFLHLFADTAASIFEQVEDEVELNGFTEKWLGLAVEAVDKAMAIKPEYAKYYCTKGRLLAFCGRDKYRAALHQVDIAIDKEISTRGDYLSRINGYERARLEIGSRHRQRELQEKLDAVEGKFQEYEQKMQDSNIKMMEMLGLFAGILGFLIGSVQLLNGQPFLDAARLIVVLMGSTICVYSAFTFIVHKLQRETVLRSLLMLLFGLVTIGGGLLFCSIA